VMGGSILGSAGRVVQSSLAFRTFKRSSGCYDGEALALSAWFQQSSYLWMIYLWYSLCEKYGLLVSYRDRVRVCAWK
jgi:hypothetical protein